jgi:hypothetical protein
MRPPKGTAGTGMASALRSLLQLGSSSRGVCLSKANYC